METKVGKLKTNANGKIEFTRKELREYSLAIVNEAIMKSMLACCGYLMDEPEFNYDAEKIAQVWTGVDRYIKVISDPNSAYKVKDLCKTITEYTGIKVYW